MGLRAQVTWLFLMCLLISLCLSLAAAMSFSFVILGVSEPYANIWNYLDGFIATLALFTAVFAFVIMSVTCIAMASLFVVEPNERKDRVRWRALNAARRTLVWFAIPALLVGGHVACWVMMTTINNPSFGWYQRAPTPAEIASVWFAIHAFVIVIGFAVYVMSRVIRIPARSALAGSDLCHSCGYSREGLAGDICPECGATFA
ncbi:MAG: hypothetical protein ED559_10750 [Phycisphaera sp.]|nr:MAG: hypothetical protein ED559_10750 [Phycisphaera sp.]